MNVALKILLGLVKITWFCFMLVIKVMFAFMMNVK